MNSKYNKNFLVYSTSIKVPTAAGRTTNIL